MISSPSRSVATTIDEKSIDGTPTKSFSEVRSSKFSAFRPCHVVKLVVQVERPSAVGIHHQREHRAPARRPGQLSVVPLSE